MVGDELRSQIEELILIRRVDQEMSAAAPNFDNVMMLTMDWALRRTGSSAGILSMVNQENTGLIPLVVLGYSPEALPYDDRNPLSISIGLTGRAARTNAIQYAGDVWSDPDYMPWLSDTRSQIAVPISMRNRLLGVIVLESERPDAYDEANVSFVKWLASRAAIVLDSARLYREADRRADDMATLYSASRTISSSLERSEVLTNAAQSIASVLNVSGAILADYRADQQQLTITAVYRLGTAKDAPDMGLTVGDIIDLDPLPELRTLIYGQHVMTTRLADATPGSALQGFMEQHKCLSLLVAPLSVQNQILGVALAIEGRQQRRFTRDEILMAESLMSQIASAIRQAKLYEDVRELENLKSEMIRMASHDLRNPLGSAMGYFEMLAPQVIRTLNETQQEYVGHIRRSLNTIKSLLEDLLTLDRIESERQTAWVELDFNVLAQQVVDGQMSAARLKQHEITVENPEGTLTIVGSATQLRQAVTNLVSNAIKYTPDNGKIQVRFKVADKRLTFEVQDNGYGISKERQSRLYQRFYRARQPGTDHIAGTGLGLSLVKTVIERHGGEVWVESEPGQGSTFGFWLPFKAQKSAS